MIFKTGVNNQTDRKTDSQMDIETSHHLMKTVTPIAGSCKSIGDIAIDKHSHTHTDTRWLAHQPRERCD